MRNDTQSTLVFGTRAIIESILSGQTVEKVLIANNVNASLHQDLLSLVREKNIPHSYVPKVKINKLTRRNHQGVVAYLSPIVFAPLSQIVQTCYEQGKHPLILLLDGVTDVRNFGAIVRTATCTAVDAIVIPSRRSAAVSGAAMKTSAGALAYLPICRVDNLKAAMHYLQASGLQVIACHEKAGSTLYQTNLDMPLAILLGAEDHGISPQHLKVANKHMQIPIWGPITSLNVATAAAVVLYEHIRQQKFRV